MSLFQQWLKVIETRAGGTDMSLVTRRTSDGMVKYNRLLRVEEPLSKAARYPVLRLKYMG